MQNCQTVREKCFQKLPEFEKKFYRDHSILCFHKTDGVFIFDFKRKNVSKIADFPAERKWDRVDYCGVCVIDNLNKVFIVGGFDPISETFVDEHWELGMLKIHVMEGI